MLRPALLLAAILASVSAAAAQPGPHPQRPVASIVSPMWNSSDQRDSAREIDQIVSRLKLKHSDVVADIGAGNGYDTVRLASRVRAVIAEDVMSSYLDDLRRTILARKLTNVRLVLGDYGDPRLPPRSIDAAIMIHMYHEIGDPYALLAHLAGAFKPDGRLGIEELDRPTQFHGTPPRLLVCELAAAGYRLETLRPLKGQIGYFAVFKPPPVGRLPDEGMASRCRP